MLAFIGKSMFGPAVFVVVCLVFLLQDVLESILLLKWLRQDRVFIIVTVRISVSITAVMLLAVVLPIYVVCSVV